jgi:monothiol glutaredoxin
MKITAYLKPSCGWSRGVRAVFQKYGLSFEDKDIINVPANYAEMVQVSGQSLQPTIVIDGTILADVSGEDVERWLVSNNKVSLNEAPAAVPTNSACSDAEHAAQRAATVESHTIRFF